MSFSTLRTSSTLFFFFQAEDVIRGGHVTGVHTCALPISAGAVLPSASSTPSRSAWSSPDAGTPARSEERRVGKESRSRGSPYHYKKKRNHEEEICAPSDNRIRQTRRQGMCNLV